MTLNVYSVQRSLHFYRDLLGLQLIGKPTDDSALLSTFGSNNNDHLLHLSKAGSSNRTTEGEQSVNQQAGLYHFAILLPSRMHLANIFKHISQNSNELYFEGAADHLVSESLYLRDPDFNGVEIYRDRDRSEWNRIGQFQVEMKTDHLNLKQLLKEAGDKILWRMPADAVIGHVHLHVSDLNKSSNFYSQILGLHHTCSYPGANFFAADSYHHHVAINTWLGNDIAKANQRQPGLDHFSLNLKSKENFEKLLHHVKSTRIQDIRDNIKKTNKESFFISDPDNIKIQICYQ